MGVIEAYIIFSIATSLTSWIIWVRHIIKKAQEAGIDNIVTNKPGLYFLVYFILASIFAPYIFIVFLNKKAEVSFVRGMYSSIAESD